MDKEHWGPDVSLQAHPSWLLLVSTLGAGLAYCYILNHHTLGVSLAWYGLLGLCTGIPALLWAKRHLRKNVGFWVDYYRMDAYSQCTWPVMKRYYACFLPFQAEMFLFVCIGSFLRSPIVLAGALACSFCFLLYPEQKAIWLAAKARVAQMENSDMTSHSQEQD
jgi:hypothetical protein